MHSEYYMVDKEAAQKINNAKKNGHNVVCVGTTSCRTVESATNEEGIIEKLVVGLIYLFTQDTNLKW